MVKPEKEKSSVIKFYISCFILGILIIAIFAGIDSVANRYRPFNIGMYESLLDRLEGKDFMVVHDCDFQVEGISRLLAVERARNISAIYFLRPDADYFTQNIIWFQDLERQGVKFGFHYDSLSRSRGWSISLNDYYPIPKYAKVLFKAQLTFMRSFLNISYTRAHGDNFDLDINNYRLYDAELWQSLNLTDLSNEQPFHVGYVADTNHIWQENLTEPILVNLHSDYW